MKGLLIKDFVYLKPLQTVGLMLAGSLIFMITDMPLALSYIVLLGTAFSQVSFTYDEQKGGMRYILSLPISRAQYVQSKYIFLLGIQFCMLLIGMILRLCIGGERAGVLLWIGIGIAFYLAVTAVFIPALLILGRRREMLGSMLTVIPFILAVLHRSIGGALPLMVWQGAHLLPLLIGSLILLVISYFISLRIMEKKEY